MSVGGLFSVRFVRVTVTSDDNVVPSLTLYVNVASPSHPTFGVKVKEPSEFKTNVPSAGKTLVCKTALSVLAGISGSVSLANTPIGAGIVLGVSPKTA